MHSKAIAALLFSMFAFAAAELEPKRDNSSGGYDHYSSLMSELNGLASDTSYMDYLSDMPTDYSQYVSSDPTDSPNIPVMTSGPAMPPPSIQSVIITAIPPSYMSQMANPSARESIFNEIAHGNYPDWYDNLPASVKDWVSSHYATGYGTAPTGGPGSGSESESESESGSGSGSGGNVPDAAPPSGVVATGLLGAAGILALAVML